MALPRSRNTTYTAKSQVKSADLNAMQDAIAEAWAEPILNLSMASAQLSGGATYSITNGDITFPNASGGSAVFGIDLPVGRMITEIRVRLKDGGSSNEMDVSLRSAVDGTGTEEAADQSDESGAVSEVVLDELEVEIEEGKSYALIIANPGTTNDRFLYSVAIEHEPAPEPES